MGSDIHGVFQKRTPDGWEDVPSQWEQNRHYYLFSILANVRNGFGFAGVKTYDPVAPISAQRGLPDDFLMDGEDHPIQTLEVMDAGRAKWHQPGEPLAIWMGDHSHSWLTADEILAYADHHAQLLTRHTGILSREEYAAWDKASEPENYCGGISGRDIVVSTPGEMTERTTHVSVSWVGNQLTPINYFIEEVRRLKKEHGDVRLVFGFDS